MNILEIKLTIKLTKTKESIQNNEIIVSLLRKSKRQYYSDVNVKNITDNKISDKVTSGR